ncbi:hypothetical protein SAMN04489724_0073 [Algoriphagus locisalis]|uniref:Nucleotide modification associated domain-containing protein n=1 Tax=Algoriphagus locisalis TaxID=305507 RepID=A0A1I7E4X8_9BACT|nr:hypothetical protein [Algoriphagus locisalis]SFU18984.1 hypothetical protein SAMN04489724_0073 [Algoriphagus locisalis]
MKKINFGCVGKIKLNSYHPLCKNDFGRNAIKGFGFHPFVDGSCRREPDFENLYPSITGLCRQNSFAPKLWPNDIVIYMSLDSEGNSTSKYSLVAILKVIERFETHFNAYQWYRDNDLKTPNNCMVEGNPPIPFEMTVSTYTSQKDITRFKKYALDKQKAMGERIVNKWNDEYQIKSEKWPTFIVTKPFFNAVYEDLKPPIIEHKDFVRIMGRVPNTRTPNNLSVSELIGFCNLAGIKPLIK